LIAPSIRIFLVCNLDVQQPELKARDSCQWSLEVANWWLITPAGGVHGQLVGECWH